MPGFSRWIWSTVTAQKLQSKDVTGINQMEIIKVVGDFRILTDEGYTETHSGQHTHELLLLWFSSINITVSILTVSRGEDCTLCVTFKSCDSPSAHVTCISTLSNTHSHWQTDRPRDLSLTAFNKTKITTMSESPSGIKRNCGWEVLELILGIEGLE